MRVILVSYGSLGDTLPFLAWGRALLARGHQVTLIGNGYYRQLIEKEGIELVELGAADAYRKFLADVSYWQRGGGKNDWADLIDVVCRDVYALVAERIVPGKTVVAAVSYFFGARIAQEKLGVPLATVHLQPMWLRSIYDSPAIPDWCPRVVPKAIDRLLDACVLDRQVGRPVNRFRGELGLPPVRRVLKYWWNSPDLVVGFFPAWFSCPQPDWPANTRLVGFPRYAAASEESSLAEMEAFLAAGERPIVFSLSSVTTDAAPYFRIAAEATLRLGMRAILLTPYAEQVPPGLPPTIRQFRFLPLERLLPRAALHVHHAGSGTTAHTLAAGIPQLIVPQGTDQLEIAGRIKRLGVSRTVFKRQYRVERVVSAARELLTSQTVAERCHHFAELSKQDHAVEDATQALEQLLLRQQRAADQDEFEGSQSRQLTMAEGE